MDVGLILKVAGIGLLISCVTVILNKSGRDEQAMLVTAAGVVVVMLVLIGELSELFELIRTVFGF